MARTTAQLRPNDIIVDVEPTDIPPEIWTAGVNVNFRSNEAQRVGGVSVILGGGSSPPLHHFPVLTRLAAQWIYATVSNEYFVTDGSSHFNITPAIVPAPTGLQPYNHTTLNGVPILNDGAAAPSFWDLNTSNIMLPLPGFPANTQVAVLRAYKNYLIGLFTDVGGVTNQNGIIWSDSAPAGTLPNQWTPAVGNDAGDAEASETPGPIIDGAQLRDSFVVYKRGSCYVMDFIGGNFVFSLRKLFTTVGALAVNCVVEVRGVHYVFSDGDIIRHDGNSVESIVDRRWRKWVFSEMDPQNFLNSFVVHYKAANEIWFCYPRTGQTYPDVALVYNYEENRIGYRLLNQAIAYGAAGIVPAASAGNDSWDLGPVGTWDSDSNPWDSSNFSAKVDKVILADSGAEFQLVDDTETQFNGDSITAYLEKGGMDLGDPDRVKTVKAVWPRIVSAGGQLEVRVGIQLAPHDAITWHAWVAFDVATERVPMFMTGRFISYQIRSIGGGEWRSSGLDIEFEWRGNF